MSETTVSVIVPVFNNPEGLHRCLTALDHQRKDGFGVEILVVDNGSQDDPAPVVGSHSHARLLRETRPGSYAARNRGLSEASGEVIVFTDADCEPTPTWLSDGLKALATCSRAGLAAGRVEVHPRDAGRPTVAERYDSLFAFPVERYVSTLHFGVTANLFARRDLLIAIGTFDERLRSGGDAEWCQRAHAAGWKIIYAPEAVVRHPARQNLGEVLRKTRRVVWGREALRTRRYGAERRPMNEIRRMLRHAARDARIAVCRRVGAPLHQRVQVAALASGVHVVDMVETFRCRRGLRHGAIAPRS